MKRALRWLDINFEPLFMSITFFLMAGLITLQVILRFVFQSGFAWGEEISRFIFVWLVFLSIPYAARNGRHIGIDFIRDLFPVSVRKAVLIIVDVLGLIMFGIFLNGAFDIVAHAIEFGDRAQTISISMNWLHYAAIVGYILIEIRILQSLIWKLRYRTASFELFKNPNGRYSGANDLFFMPLAQREQEEALLEQSVLEEQQARKNRRGGEAL